MKLPLCPYCEARFLYPDVKDSKKQKTGICPHCKKEFRIVYRRREALLFLFALLLLVGVNWLLLTIPAMNFPFLMVITAIGIIITYFLIPYTVQYKIQ
jgi:CXXC-20-CXXC protein